MSPQLSCPACKAQLAVPNTFAGAVLACPSCGYVFDAAVSEQPTGAVDDFEEMTRIAARDNQITGAKVGIQQARLGTYSLLGAAALVAIAATVSSPFLNLETIKPFSSAILLTYLTAAVLFVILFFWARHEPLAPLVTGLVLFALLSPLVIVTCLTASSFWVMGPLIVIFGLIDGVRAAIQLNRIRRRAMMTNVVSTASSNTAPLPTPTLGDDNRSTPCA
jgi:hypothetical protein